ANRDYDFDFDDSPAPAPAPTGASPSPILRDVNAKPAVVVGLAEAQRRSKKPSAAPPQPPPRREPAPSAISPGVSPRPIAPMHLEDDPPSQSQSQRKH